MRSSRMDDPPDWPEWLRPAATAFSADADAAARDFEAARRGTCKAKRAYLASCGLARTGKLADLHASTSLASDSLRSVLSCVNSSLAAL